LSTSTTKGSAACGTSFRDKIFCLIEWRRWNLRKPNTFPEKLRNFLVINFFDGKGEVWQIQNIKMCKVGLGFYATGTAMIISVFA